MIRREPIKRKEQKKRRKGPKRACFFAHLVLLILTFLLFPLNIFVVNFPKWVVVLSGILTLIVLVVYLVVFRTKIVTKIILPVLYVGIVGFLLIVTYCCPYWNSYSFKQADMVRMNFDEELSYEQAAEDFAAAMRRLEHVHPLFRNGLTPEIRERYETSLAALGEMQTITVNDLRREIQFVINPLHDAHTTTYNSWPEDYYLIEFLEKQRQGYFVYSINGRTVAEILDAAAAYYSYESEAWINVDLVSLATLRFYGYEEPFTYVWKNEAGELVTESYTETDFVTWEEFDAVSQSYRGNTAEEPTEEASDSFVYYEIDEEKSLAVLTLTACNYNEEYRECVKEMFREVKAKQIQNVAVDVRGNGGGNSMVANEVIRYLPVTEYLEMPCDWRWGWFVISFDNQRMKNKQYEDLLFDGALYVLTDSSSFSAAMDFAMLIQDNDLGYVVGEAPANSTNGYGDVALFSLPNSGLLMQISTKKWYRIDETNTDDYVIPDFPCSGTDVMETLYSLL